MNAHSDGPPVPAYWNPYLAGIGLGLTLLLAFVVLGVGLGASGTTARAAAAAAHAVHPEAARANTYLAPWLDGASPLASYVVAMSAGTLLGGLASAVLARRSAVVVERGVRCSALARLALAVAGGVLVGFASRLAGGCTSGVGLTGGAQFLPGSWAFLAAMFAAGFLAAPLVAREWTR